MLAQVEAVAAEHRPALCRPEGHCRVLATDRANRRSRESFSRRGGALRALTLARFAVFGFVREVLFSEKRLFPRGPDEFRPARDTPESLVLELHRSSPKSAVLQARPWHQVDPCPLAKASIDKDPHMAEVNGPLVQFPALLFSTAFTSEGLFRPALVTRLQIERVLLDILDDIFLLHLPLEAAQGAFDGFAFLDFYFSQALSTPSPAGIVHSAPTLRPAKYEDRRGANVHSIED